MVKQFLEKMGLPQRVEVIADPGLERGAVILDSTRGGLDASVETQLKEIERDFADLVRRVMIKLAPYRERLARMETCRWTGSVTELVGLLVESNGPAAAVGDFCEIGTQDGRVIRTQVIGFRDGRVLSMPLEETDGLHLGDPIIGPQGGRTHGGGPGAAGPGDGWLRKATGRPRRRSGPRNRTTCMPPRRAPWIANPSAKPLVTGIRAIDSLLTCGKGQRIGIFGGSGVGKSTLLGAMSRHNSADVSVIALIGERNREVRDFIEHELGPEGLKRSVVVVATSDRPAPLRIRAAFVALAVAEYFRDQGKDVLLVMDSVTRLAMAQREIGLAAGEPPSQKGYTPSVFNLLPKIFERAGRFRKGSITGFSRCWWKATISTSRFATPCAPSWTATSFFPANWARRGTIRPSTFCNR